MKFSVLLGFPIIITSLAACGSPVEGGVGGSGGGSTQGTEATGGFGSDVSSTSSGASICGDGQVDPGEECDDGNLVGGDACTADCKASTCVNGIKDLEETDVDCGGACLAKCELGKGCNAPADCAQGTCLGNTCQILPTCSDGEKNGTETWIDCGGGSCEDCASGGGCVEGSDCVSGVCTGGLCQDPTCNDGVKNSVETGIDCGGGLCDDCDAGSGCVGGTDCISGVCTGGLCQDPTCNDWVKNNAETGIDCGGGTCDGCASGGGCVDASDCLSGICTGGSCQAPSCTDGVKNGSEAGTDCGGSCPVPCVVQVDAGSSHTCAVLDSGSIKCWGFNGYGQLGLGHTGNQGDAAGEMGDALPAVALGTGRKATSIATGDFHACAILDNGSIKCWGGNAFGQLGLGNTEDLGDAAGEMGDALPSVALGTGRKAVSISAGDVHTCAILDNGSVKCWGRNYLGALGLGDTVNRGDSVGEMGDALPSVALGTGRTATSISAGGSHTCALLDNGSVKCWGYNEYGELGQGNTQTLGDAPGEMGNALPIVALGTGRSAVSISAGGLHTCAVLDDGSVKCWGFNLHGQLGLGNMQNRGDASGEMGNSLSVVSLGTGRTAISIMALYNHTCVVLDNGLPKCWGYNNRGQLGLGNTLDVGDAPGEMGDALPSIALGTGRTTVSVAAGGNHTCAILDNGSLKCWGYNALGQLGLDGTQSWGDNPDEMDDTLPVIPL